ncbi:MAG TPA: efflux RND transporter periplasmic adaptor subunit [Kofleriaceae bacterium]|nr:efflux RND transporter periplasmic adaptor subunit [Kofleriaceae bacterium]
MCAVLLGLAACSAAAEPSPTFSPPPSTEAPDHARTVDPRSQPYVKTRAVAYETDVPAVRAPAKVAFRDGAVSQVDVPVAGRVTAIHVQTGDRVKAGQPLITLSSTDAAAARAGAAAAQAEADAAHRELTRQEQMSAAGVGVDTDRVAAQERVRQADAELARARTAATLLGDGGGGVLILRAPIDGTVIARHATVGSMAEPGGEPLIELGNPDALWVEAEVFERDLAQVHVGATARVELPSDDHPRQGHVVAIGSALTGSLRTAPVYIGLDDTGGAIRPGMFARATIDAPAGQAIVLPAEAVLVEDGKRYVVYVEGKDGRYTARDVAIGRSVDGKVQVLAGLDVGDQVVVSGALLIDNAAEQLL